MDKFSYKITSNSSTRENISNKNRYLNLVQELAFENISNEKLHRTAKNRNSCSNSKSTLAQIAKLTNGSRQGRSCSKNDDRFSRTISAPSGKKWREHVACWDQCVCKLVVFHAASRRLWATPRGFYARGVWTMKMALLKYCNGGTWCIDAVPSVLTRSWIHDARVSYRKYRSHHSVSTLPRISRRTCRGLVEMFRKRWH